jgi:hypothetical protein
LQTKFIFRTCKLNLLVMLLQETVIIQEFEKADYQILRAFTNQIKYFFKFQSKYKEGNLR